MPIFSNGENVWVPAEEIGAFNSEFALKKVQIDRTDKRSVFVTVDGQAKRIASKKVLRNPAVLLISIGDYVTEQTLIQPLSKSIFHFMRLLVPDDCIRFVSVRSMPELKFIWNRESAAYQYVIFIGHGKRDGLKFGDVWVGSAVLSDLFKDNVKRNVIFLCCKTGSKKLAGSISECEEVMNVVAPLNSVPGAEASQLVQDIFTCHFLWGYSFGSAYNRANESARNKSRFRRWRNGRLQ